MSERATVAATASLERMRSPAGIPGGRSRKLRGILPGLCIAMLAIPFSQLAQAVDLSRKFDFAIPPQTLSAALIQFSHQSRLQVIVRDDVRMQKVPGISGRHAIDDALRRLLEGTGLSYRVAGETSIVIEKATSASQSGSNASSAGEPPDVPSPPAPASDEASRYAEVSPVLEQVVVLGSLLPQPALRTSSPVITITSEEMKNRGFTSIADAIQNLSVNTGGVNNTSINMGDVWAAKEVSLFGLDPSYTKILIDGRPMPLFSQIAQGSLENVLVNNLSAIPIDLVDRIEILPGSASSLYGSDAVAGVINIVMKKHSPLATVDAGYNWYGDGGGDERKFSFTTNFGNEKWNVMLGGQFSYQQPLWAFERGTTAQNFARGEGPQTPLNIAFVDNLFTGVPLNVNSGNCANLAGLWRGTVQDVAGSCATDLENSFRTLFNRDKTDAVLARVSFSVSANLQLYTDIYDTYEEQAQAGDLIWGGYWYDAAQNALLLSYRWFAPEEMANSLGGLLNQTDYENTLVATLGAKGAIGNGWIYDTYVSLSREGLDNSQRVLWANANPSSFGYAVLGPQLGSIPLGTGALPIYAANFTDMFSRFTPQQVAAFGTTASTESSSRDDTFHIQVSKPDLIRLPGGDAGLALVAEAGHEGWAYLPAAGFANGAFATGSWNSSGGVRSRYAGAAELDMPLMKMVTLDTSGRYDAYDAGGDRFHKATYSLGLQIRPVQSVLLRGKYGTGFKAPSLIDEFEGLSASTGTAVDFANCARLGFTGVNLANCPPQYVGAPVTLQQVHNPGLQPITTQSWSYGVVFSPLRDARLSVDYQHLDIREEVLTEDAATIVENQMFCEQGTIDPRSPTCQAANAQIIRGPAPPGSALLGNIQEIILTKINLADELNNSINVEAEYGVDLWRLGHFDMDVAYVNVLDHRRQTYPGDPILNLLSDPYYGVEFKSKVNASLSWSKAAWSATIFGTRVGRTQNFAAYSTDSWAAPGAGTLPPWTVWNASVGYMHRDLQLFLRVNNVGNTMPPLDRTAAGSNNTPFLPEDYNPYGRQFVMEAKYEFGGASE